MRPRGPNCLNHVSIWATAVQLADGTIDCGRVEPPMIRAASEPAAPIHTLRHSAAVSWLEAGVHIKAVSDLLGHSSIAITGGVYGHTSDETARAAVDGRAGRLGL